MDLEREGKLPVPIGIFDAKQLQFEKLPLQMLEMTQSQNLVDLAKEYDLALLQLPFLTIPFESSVLGAYVAETKRDPDPKLLVSPRIPFVVGFPQVLGTRGLSWDHKLVILNKGTAEHLVNWLGTVAFNDTSTTIGYRIRVQTGVISDVFEFEKHTQEFQVPTLKVPMLCVESTMYCYYFLQKQKIGLTYPILTKNVMSEKEFDRFLKNWRAGERDLYGAANGDRNQAKQDHGATLSHRGDVDQDRRDVDDRENQSGG